VIKLRNHAAQEYFKSWVELDEKKDRLFQAGDLAKWEIDFNDIKLKPEDIIKNHKIAKTLMLPGVHIMFNCRQRKT
jgi:hypothetical protein